MQDCHVWTANYCSNFWGIFGGPNWLQPDGLRSRFLEKTAATDSKLGSAPMEKFKIGLTEESRFADHECSHQFSLDIFSETARRDHQFCVKIPPVSPPFSQLRFEKKIIDVGSSWESHVIPTGKVGRPRRIGSFEVTNSGIRFGQFF